MTISDLSICCFCHPLLSSSPSFHASCKPSPLHLSVLCFEWGNTHNTHAFGLLSVEHHSPQTTICSGNTGATIAGRGTDVLSHWTCIQAGARLESLEPSYNSTEGAYMRKEPAKEKAEPIHGEGLPRWH